MEKPPPMSAEKRLLLFLVLSFGILFLYSTFMSPKTPPKTPPAPGPVATGTGTATGTGGPPAAPRVEPGPEGPVPAPAGSLATVAPGQGEVFEVDTGRIRWGLDSYGGTVRRADLKEFAGEPGKDLALPEYWYPALSAYASDGRMLAPDSRRSLALRLYGPDGRSLSGALPLDRVIWERAEASAGRVVYRLAPPDAGFILRKVFTFPAAAEGVTGGPYHLMLSIEAEVTDAAKAAATAGSALRFRLNGPGGTRVERFATGLTVIGAALQKDTVSVKEIGPPKKADSSPPVWPEEISGDTPPLEWVGLHSRFFGGILKPMDPGALGIRQAVFEPLRDRTYDGEEIVNLSPAVDFSLRLPEAGKTARADFLFFVGPLDPKLFSDGAYSTFAPIIDYGLFGGIAKALVFLLGLLHSIAGNWGIAIIVLTLIVRLALFPLSRRSQVSMQKQGRQMARLKPKLDALAERYKNNKKKMNEEKMKLFREENVRIFPMGCLIIFLQLPIFIGLFQALRYSIGLRHSRFLWAADLTVPDMLLGPLATKGIPLVPDPFYLNVFPVIMAVTWFLSSAMAPKAADPQQAQTQKMMRWMTILFSLLLYNYPAGLALYMVVSSTWSIFESRVVRKLIAAHDEAVAAPAIRKGK